MIHLDSSLLVRAKFEFWLAIICHIEATNQMRVAPTFWVPFELIFDPVILPGDGFIIPGIMYINLLVHACTVL